MATIILWHFDKYLRKNNLAGYNHQLVQEFQQMQKQKQEEKQRLAAEEEELKK